MPDPSTFRDTVADAAGDPIRLADLMAEAIAYDRETRERQVVGRDGRERLTIERLQAAYNLDAARAAYLLARGSNADPR